MIEYVVASLKSLQEEKTPYCNIGEYYFWWQKELHLRKTFLSFNQRSRRSRYETKMCTCFLLYSAGPYHV